MRLMLGTENNPSLLVEPYQLKSPTEFDFYVVNGDWEGYFKDGYITVYGCPGGAYSSLDKLQILTDNQDRLRGEYQDVFYHFDNVDYVAPKINPVKRPESWDDTIPF